MNTPKSEKRNYKLSANVEKTHATIGILVGDNIYSYATSTGSVGNLYKKEVPVKANISPEEAVIYIDAEIAVEGDLTEDLCRAYSALKDYHVLAQNASAPIPVNINKLLGIAN